MKYQYFKDKENWEQTRFISLCVAQSNSKKKLKETDILKFSWDKENKKKEFKPMSDAELERLKQQAREYIKNKELTNPI